MENAPADLDGYVDLNEKYKLSDNILDDNQKKAEKCIANINNLLKHLSSHVNDAKKRLKK